MITLLNPASLILGIISWGLPILNIIKYKKYNNENWVTLSIISVSTCAISICFQLIYNNHLVVIGDLSALMDMIGMSVFLSSVLLIITIILNITTLLIYSNKARK